MILTWMVFWMRNVSRNVKQQLEQAVDKALQRGNHHGWALVMMVFSPLLVRGWSRSSFCWRHSSRMSASGRRWGRCWAWPRQSCWASCSTGAVSALTSACSSNGPACLFCWWPLAWPRGAIRAFHEAGLWNLFQDTAFDLSNVLSTHTLFGTLLEGIFGYQETPSVSEVAVYLLYLIPALVLFALPPRNNTTASRAA